MPVNILYCEGVAKSPVIFRERILKGIEETVEDVWTWLPEWQQLRNLMAQ